MRPDQRFPRPERASVKPNLEIVVDELVFKGMNASEAWRLADALPQALQAALAGGVDSLNLGNALAGNTEALSSMRTSWEHKPGTHFSDAAASLAQTLVGTLSTAYSTPSNPSNAEKSS